MRCRSHETTAKIVSKHPSTNRWQLVHSPSAPGFDEGRERGAPTKSSAKGFLTQTFSEHFCGSEFFNSHAWFRQSSLLLLQCKIET
jgi:hypothetical protein